jgi:hypothetical protein
VLLSCALINRELTLCWVALLVHILGGLMEQTLILIYFMLFMSYKNIMLV